MTSLIRTCFRLVLPALLAAGPASAQVGPAQPLGHDPARAAFAPTAAQLQAQQRGTTALPLPFFDDFTTPLEGAPRPANWELRGGALVNNRYAIRPLTRGTATLDGLRADGSSYSGLLASRYGVLDSLTSQPINLAGLGPADQVALSFAWQAGSVVGAPHASAPARPVNLELYVKTDANVWESVWVYASLAQVTGFRQQVVLLNQAKYLHGLFQFRFVARGNISDNSDTWNVDYVLLNRGRANGLADTTFVDAAISGGFKGANPTGGLRSPLRRFTAMPAWQFSAAPATASELSPVVGVNVVNLRAGTIPLITGVQGTVRDLTAATPLGTWLQSSKTLYTGFPIPSARLDSVYGDARRQPVPPTAIPRRLRYTLSLSTQEVLQPVYNTLANDTISRDVDLSNYYAFDDGTAENITALVPFPTGQAPAFAYRIDLNQPDYVRGLRLYPMYPGTELVGSTNVLDMGARPVTISVWDDVAGQPGPTARATRSTTIPAAAAIPAGWQYYQVDFAQPVAVSGTFYVGFSQPPSNRFLPYGLDLNSAAPAGTFWARSNAGIWQPATQPGALLMRPVMTNNVATAATAATAAAAFSLYPNPTQGTVTVAGPAFARAAVLDALGRTVWTQPAATAGHATLPLALPAGVYTVRLTLPDGATVGRRLLVQ